MTAEENVILGQKGGLLFDSKDGEKITALAERFELGIDLHKRVADMSVGEKQNLEILKVLYRGARILILDEPTAVLTPQETVKLFKKNGGKTGGDCGIASATHSVTNKRIKSAVRTLKGHCRISRYRFLARAPSDCCKIHGIHRQR
jgi:simple sugar transport system ATP-binding protein